MLTPTVELATRIAQEFLGVGVNSTRRFETGLHHFVYEVIADDGSRIVVRIGARESRADLAGAVFWTHRLTPLGIPLARILHADLDMDQFAFPYLLLERLPGTDLVNVYPHMSKDQRCALACQIVEVQRIAADLPLGRGFGYAYDEYSSAMLPSNWKHVLEDDLARSRSRIERTRIVDPTWVRRVEARLDEIDEQLAVIAPRAFFHDITTKNVIVNQGSLSGIVDVDTMAYGDPLLTIALTRTSILSRGWDADYIDAWTEAIDLTGDEAVRLDAYTALFAVNFLSELGQIFNQARPPPAVPEYRDRLVTLLEECAI